MRLQDALFVVALFAAPSYLHAGPDTAESLYQHGLKLERVRSYDAAASFYDAALKADPKFAPAFRQLGNCHYYLGDKGQAYRDYQDYLELKPEDKAIAAFSAKLLPRLKGGATGKGVIQLRGFPAPPGMLSGYNFYMGEAAGGAYKKLNENPLKDMNYLVEGLVVGRKYYFCVSSVTLKGSESKLSQEFSLTAFADTK